MAQENQELVVMINGRGEGAERAWKRILPLIAILQPASNAYKFPLQ